MNKVEVGVATDTAALTPDTPVVVAAIAKITPMSLTISFASAPTASVRVDLRDQTGGVVPAESEFGFDDPTALAMVQAINPILWEALKARYGKGTVA